MKSSTQKHTESGLRTASRSCQSHRRWHRGKFIQAVALMLLILLICSCSVSEPIEESRTDLAPDYLYYWVSATPSNIQSKDPFDILTNISTDSTELFVNSSTLGEFEASLEGYKCERNDSISLPDTREASALYTNGTNSFLFTVWGKHGKDTRIEKWDIPTGVLIKGKNISIFEESLELGVSTRRDVRALIKELKGIAQAKNEDDVLSLLKEGKIAWYNKGTDKLESILYREESGRTYQIRFHYSSNIDKDLLTGVNINTDCRSAIELYESGNLHQTLTNETLNY